MNEAESAGKQAQTFRTKLEPTAWSSFPAREMEKLRSGKKAGCFPCRFLLRSLPIDGLCVDAGLPVQAIEEGHARPVLLQAERARGVRVVINDEQGHVGAGALP